LVTRWAPPSIALNPAVSPLNSYTLPLLQPAARPTLLSPHSSAPQTKTAEVEALAAVGDGGFSPNEFELLQELGTINIQQAGGRGAGLQG
jgi:hypothetical protein